MKLELQEILEFQRDKHQEYLAKILNNLPPETFDEIVNKELDLVSPAQAKNYGIANFDKVDRYPNPKDGLLSKDEIAERLSISRESKERAVLLWIWLNFEHIRLASDDFDGHEKTFDVVLTLKDFQDMPG